MLLHGVLDGVTDLHGGLRWFLLNYFLYILSVTLNRNFVFTVSLLANFDITHPPKKNHKQNRELPFIIFLKTYLFI